MRLAEWRIVRQIVEQIRQCREGNLLH
jgi:hypothetical protein